MLNQQMNDLMNGHSKRELVQLARAKGFKGDSERIAINCEDGQTLTGKAAIAYWLVNGDEGRVMDEQRDDQQAEQAEQTPPPPKAAASKPAKPANLDAAKAAQMAELLGELFKPALDADEIRGIVRQEVEKLPVQIQRIVVDYQQIERKVEGHTHAAFDKVVKLAGIRQNILLVGPAGCGKTQLAHQVADSLGLQFGMISCTAGMSESQLTGWLLPVEAGGAFSYVPARFVDLYENGGLFLLDEIDAADENTLLVMNAALANGHLHIPTRTNNPSAKRHPDFVCIAAANTFGHGGNMIYAGRNKLDGATLDRFRAGIVAMDYDEKLESQIVDSEVLAWALPIRKQINSLNLRRVMSTRVMLDFTKQKQALGFGKDDWKQSYFADWTKDELNKMAA
jgi:hypothetical protein